MHKGKLINKFLKQLGLRTRKKKLYWCNNNWK